MLAMDDVRVLSDPVPPGVVGARWAVTLHVHRRDDGGFQVSCEAGPAETQNVCADRRGHQGPQRWRGMPLCAAVGTDGPQNAERRQNYHPGRSKGAVGQLHEANTEVLGHGWQIAVGLALRYRVSVVPCLPSPPPLPRRGRPRCANISAHISLSSALVRKSPQSQCPDWHMLGVRASPATPLFARTPASSPLCLAHPAPRRPKRTDTPASTSIGLCMPANARVCMHMSTLLSQTLDGCVHQVQFPHRDPRRQARFPLSPRRQSVFVSGKPTRPGHTQLSVPAAGCRTGVTPWLDDVHAQGC